MKRFNFSTICLVLVFALISLTTAQTTLTIARADDVRALNPIRQANNSTSQVTYQIHEGLVTMNPAQELTPVLAESWELLDDNLTWRINLREGVTFHSGAPFNAEAVRWNFEKVLNPDDPGIAAGLIPPYESIEIVDEYTLDVTLTEPNGVFMNILGAPLFMIVDPTRYEELGEDYGTAPSGTGAFQFVSWTPDQRVVLEDNPDYWGEVGAEVDRVVFEVMPEATTRLIALQTGEVDIAFGVPAEEMQRFADNPDFTTYETPTMRVLWIGINTVHPKLTRDVRLALAHGVNKEQMMDFVGENGVMATGIGMPSAFGFQASDWPYDPEMSRELLDEAGWVDTDGDGIREQDGETLELSVLARGLTPGELEALQVVQLQWQEIGVSLVIERVDTGAWFSALNEGATAHEETGEIPEYELWTAASGIRTGEVGYITERPKCDQGGRNWERYCNPDYDEAFDLSQSPASEEERLEGYYAMAEIFREDVLRIPLFVLQNNTVSTSAVEGFVVNPNDSLNLKGVSVSE